MGARQTAQSLGNAHFLKITAGSVKKWGLGNGGGIRGPRPQSKKKGGKKNGWKAKTRSPPPTKKSNVNDPKKGQKNTGGQETTISSGIQGQEFLEHSLKRLCRNTDRKKATIQGKKFRFEITRAAKTSGGGDVRKTRS